MVLGLLCFRIERVNCHIIVEIAVLREPLNAEQFFAQTIRVKVTHHTEHGVNTSEELPTVILWQSTNARLQTTNCGMTHIGSVWFCKTAKEFCTVMRFTNLCLDAAIRRLKQVLSA